MQPSRFFASFMLQSSAPPPPDHSGSALRNVALWGIIRYIFDPSISGTTRKILGTTQEEVPLGVGPRIAAFLRERYPKHAAKLVARQFDVSQGTAERWLGGAAPTCTAHRGDVRALGHPFRLCSFPRGVRSAG